MPSGSCKGSSTAAGRLSSDDRYGVTKSMRRMPDRDTGGVHASKHRGGHWAAKDAWIFWIPLSALAKFEFEAGAPLSTRWDRRNG